MARAWAERCDFPNSERNACRFEIQWVTALAAMQSYPYAEAMKKGLDEYFAARRVKFTGGGVWDRIAWLRELRCV